MKRFFSFFKKDFNCFSDFFSWFSRVVLVLSFFSLFLALINFHFSFIFKILGILLGGLFVWFSIKNNRFWKNKKIIILILLWIFVALSFSVPTVFSGRDQGSLSQAAIYLSENHGLNISFPAEKIFFEIYGSGKALNFPGFFYNNEGYLTTQFPLGYISFLALFYAIFGFWGLQIANVIAFLIFVTSFYFISRKILNSKNFFWPIFLVLSSFAFTWFFKFTLGENLALGLIWLAIWKFMSWWETRKKEDLCLVSLAMGFLIFVRIEALIFLLIIFLLVFIKDKNFIKNPSKSIKIVSVISSCLFVATLFLNQSFYRVIVKSFLPKTGEGGVSLSFFQEIIHTFNVLSIYSLLIFLAFSVLGIFILIKQKKLLKILPVLIISPTLLFLFDPGISDDHPWMLRRFLYTIIPAVYLYSIVFLEVFFKKRKAFIFFSSLLVVYNLMVMLPYLSFVPQKNLLEETKKISQNFSEKDLILIDRMATGDSYAMMAGPLNSIFDKQAAYFFNIEDLEKINLKEFEEVFFIIPDNNLDFYLKDDLIGKLVPQKSYIIETEKLKNVEFLWQLSLPVREEETIFGRIYKYEE